MSSELERALHACAENIDGTEGLNSALLKTKSKHHPGPFGLGRLGKLLGTTVTENPLPRSSTRDAHLQKQWAEAKQSREDQRVIADAIRSGAYAEVDAKAKGAQEAETSTNEVWVTSSRLIFLFKPAYPSIPDLLRKVTEPRNQWLSVCRRIAPGGYEYGYFQVKAALMNKGKLIGEPLPPDTLEKPRQKPTALDALSQRKPTRR